MFTPSKDLASQAMGLAILAAVLAFLLQHFDAVPNIEFTFRMNTNPAVTQASEQPSHRVQQAEASGARAPPQAKHQIVTSSALDDSEPDYKVRILSYEPFIAHLSNFVTPAERAYILDLSEPMLTPSVVVGDDGQPERSDYRTSSSAHVDLYDPVIAKIRRRASEFQGYLDVSDVQITAYQPGQQYKVHHDWFGYDRPGRPTDRISTIFATLSADCEKCGTQFPLVPVDRHLMDARWCEVVDCDEEVLTTRNIPGSAIYWRNLDARGVGREDTLHAGLPAVNGSKVGMNIWTEVDITGGFFDRPLLEEREVHSR